MSYGLAAVAALTAVVGMTAGAPPAFAESRSVALVNAAKDQEAGAALAQAMRREARVRPDIRVIPQTEITRALEEPLDASMDWPARDDAARAEAQEALTGAAAALTQLDYERCLAELDRAEEVLLTVPQLSPVSSLLAELTFLRGDVYLRLDRDEEAMRELRVSRRLTPERSAIDPAVHRPELVAAFAAAGVLLPASVTLRVTSPASSAAVSVNGVAAGLVPASIPVAPGIYYVTGTLPGGYVAGRRVEIVENKSAGERLVSLAFGLEAPVDRARYLRRQLLAGAPILSMDERTRAELTRQVAELTGAESVVIIADEGTGTLGAAYFGRDGGGITRWHPAVGISPGELWARLLPRALPLPMEIVTPNIPPIDTRPRPPWWRGTPFRVAMAAVVVTAVIGIAATSLIEDDPAVVSGSCCMVRMRGGASSR